MTRLGCTRLESGPGSYVLWLQLHADRRIQVGALGSMGFAAGHYAYLGSALGPGGVAARLGRHLQVNKKPRWHVDYLRRFSHIPVVWVCYDDARREHDWASALARLPGADLPVRRFGSSDCRCPSHLVWFPQRPSLQRFRSVAGADACAIKAINTICE